MSLRFNHGNTFLNVIASCFTKLRPLITFHIFFFCPFPLFKLTCLSSLLCGSSLATDWERFSRWFTSSEWTGRGMQQFPTAALQILFYIILSSFLLKISTISKHLYKPHPCNTNLPLKGFLHRRNQGFHMIYKKTLFNDLENVATNVTVRKATLHGQKRAEVHARTMWCWTSLSAGAGSSVQE